MEASQWITARIRGIRPETPTTLTFVLDLPDLVYVAGQYVTLAITIEGTTHYRAYSLSSTPGVDSYPAITVKRVTDGVVSNHLHDTIYVGDTLQLLPPVGRFVLPAYTSPRHVVLIAGGSGIAPLYALLKAALQEAQTCVSLIYANRQVEEIIFHTPLKALQKQYGSRLHITHALSKGEWPDAVGRLNPAVLDAVLQKRRKAVAWPALYFLCGPDELMQMVRHNLTKWGVADTAIHEESFINTTVINTTVAAASAPVVNGCAAEVTVECDGEVEVCRVAAGQTILESAQEEGIDIPFACTTGFCNVCRARCKKGKVQMAEDEGLSEEELAEGYVLTCVGYPQTPKVTLVVD